MDDERTLDDLGDERIDEGLRRAFGDADEPRGSVLEAIDRLSGGSTRILLRDASGEADPALRILARDDEDALLDDDRYQIVGEIARGGIGVIYLGRDRDLGREGALKVMRPGHDEELCARLASLGADNKGNIYNITSN